MRGVQRIADAALSKRRDVSRQCSLAYQPSSTCARQDNGLILMKTAHAGLLDTSVWTRLINSDVDAAVAVAGQRRALDAALKAFKESVDALLANSKDVSAKSRDTLARMQSISFEVISFFFYWLTTGCR
jgi:hypothetical protein